MAASHHAAILETEGDGTVRTAAADIARQTPWPRGFAARFRGIACTERWHGREGCAAGDPQNTGVWIGKAAGLIDSIEPAAAIFQHMVDDAALQIRKQAGRCAA